MNGEKKVILHLVFDGVLFDQVYPRFEAMERYENRYLLDVLGKNREVSYIKNTDKLIKAETLEEWCSVISNSEIDIIYLHGLWQSYLNAVDYIQKDVVVMWWCYGMDIYENVLRWPPLFPVRLYKPKTHWFCYRYLLGRHFITSELSFYFPKLYTLLVKLYNRFTDNRDKKLIHLLSRIDYAFTPLEIELIELKKRHPYIKAKPFRLRGVIEKEPIEIHEKTGGLLLEHSANISNNHLDIIAAFKKKKLHMQGRNIYVPLSYGDKRLAERVKEEANFKGANIHCLMEALPFNEYKEMMSDCSHAVFGMIRQSGLGNIYLCIRKGIKVYFFKDSILYKQFKSSGYHVFSIEDDLNDESISEPLSYEQARTNYEIFYSKFNGILGTYQQQFDNIIKS